MRVPRDVNAEDLIKLLERYGYVVTRQKGSHIRLSKTFDEAEHAITIPNHQPIKIGTLSSIIKDVALANRLETTELYNQL